MCTRDQSVSGYLIIGYLRNLSSSIHQLPIRHTHQQKTVLRKHTEGPFSCIPDTTPTLPNHYATSTEKMPFWPFSISPPEGKEEELPWHSAIIPYLQVKEVLHTVVILPDPEFKRYQDPPGTSFMTQFTRLKLFLDAKLIRENCRAWKELQETDPGFRKIQILHETSDAYRKEAADIPNEEGPVTFPEEWKDEDFFLNWLYVNVLLHLKCLSLETLEKATQVIMDTNYRAQWGRCGEEHKAAVDAQYAKDKAQYEKNKAQMKADWEELKQEVKNEVKVFFLEGKQEKIFKGLEKERKRQEEKLLKEVRSQRKLDKEDNYQ